MELEPRNTFAKILWKYYGYTLPDPPQLMAQKLMNWLAEEGFSITPRSPEKRGFEAITEPTMIDTPFSLEDPVYPQFSEK